MLQLFEYSTTDFTAGALAYLANARNVAVTENLQQPHTISFEYPAVNSDGTADERADMITENRIVSVEGQAYRLTNVVRECNNTVIIKAQGERIFFTDARAVHLPNVPDMIGVDPYEVLENVFADTKFHLLTNDELSELGMERIGTSGALIDWFSVDKTDPYDVCQTVIESYGKGEIYVDNYNIAIVERIGKDNGIRLTLDKNMTNLSIQRQTTELVTRLYPYGKDDMTISSVNNGLPYIDSPNTAIYGIKSGYKDYSDYDNPTKLLAHAEWDLMGEDNEYRLDTPQLTISGSVIDLSKLSEYGDLEKILLGDTVHVYDDKGVVYDKRIINITYYPYSAQQPSVTIGSPSNTNKFFVAWQTSKMFRTLLKNSTLNTSKLKTNYFTGSVNSDQNPVQSDNELLKIVGDLLTIYNKSGNKRLQLGNVSGNFTLDIYDTDGKTLRVSLGDDGDSYSFAIFDSDGKKAVYIDDNGEVIVSGKISTTKDTEVGANIVVGKGTASGRIDFAGMINDSEGSIEVVDHEMDITANHVRINGIDIVEEIKALKSAIIG